MVQQGARADRGRSCPAVAIAAAGVAAIVLSPLPAPHHNAVIDPAARLTAAALPLDLDLGQLAVDAAGAGLPPAASAISDGIIGIYLTLEEWLQYGVNLLSWALRWVPFGGLLASQLNMFYDLGESIVRSLVFNTAYFLDGTESFGEALSNIGSATGTAFTTFVTDQIAWLHSLVPPLPPLAAVDVLPNPDALLDIGEFPDPGTPTDLATELDGILLGLAP